MKIAKRTGAVAAAAVLSLALAACSASNEVADDSSTPASSDDTAMELSGNLAGAGASSQESAMEAWVAGFLGSNPDLTVTYDPVGSGGGRTQFLDGAVSWAGSDAQMDDEEYELAVARCGGEDGAIHLPIYISPIAVIFNLEGIDSLNMDADTIADIFNGEITSWDDEAIASQNPDVTLPSSTITIVHRADESGTTENFTDYLEQASTTWGHEASGDWAGADGESGQGTSALVQIVQDTEGTIGYADASRAGDLGTVAVMVGDDYVPFSAEAAALVVDASPAADVTNGENDLAISLDRTTTEAGAYPLVLVSYAIVCQSYDDADEATKVGEFLKYIASSEGQAASASAAGSSPISSDLSSKITAILDQIEAA